MPRKHFIAALVSIAFLCGRVPAQEQLRLPAVFTDRMVLQRGKPVTVFELVPCSGCRIVFRGVIRVPGKARPRRHIAGYVEEAQRRQGREGPTKRKVTSATRH